MSFMDNRPTDCPHPKDATTPLESGNRPGGGRCIYQRTPLGCFSPRPFCATGEFDVRALPSDETVSSLSSGCLRLVHRISGQRPRIEPSPAAHPQGDSSGGRPDRDGRNWNLAFPFVAWFRVRLRPPDGWEADARSNMGHTHNTYRLFSDTEGTRLEMTFDVHLRGPYRLFAPFARGFIVRKTSREWDDYVRAMQSGR